MLAIAIDPLVLKAEFRFFQHLLTPIYSGEMKAFAHSIYFFSSQSSKDPFTQMK